MPGENYLKVDKEEILEKGATDYKDYSYDKETAPQWKKLAVSFYMEKNPTASEKEAYYRVDKYIEKDFRELAKTGHKKATGMDSKYLYMQDAYKKWTEQVYFPEQYAADNIPKGDLRSDYTDWEAEYEPKIESAKQQIKDYVALGNYEKAKELADKFGTDFKGIDISDITTQVEEIKPAGEPDVVTPPGEPEPEEGVDYAAVAREEVEKLGITPEAVRDYRAELLKKPELEQMSPEFRDYLTNTLEGIDRATKEAVTGVETRAARAGLSPYAQREAARTLERGTFARTGTEAQLRLQDLEQRMGAFRQREAERRAFLERDYATMQQTGLQLADMMQRRANETEDDYKNRMRYLEDELRQRGWQEQDIKQAQEFAISGQYRGRQWSLQDEARRRRQALQDYEMQKRDWMEQMKQLKPKESPWWQQALQGVGGAIGGGLGGAAFGAASSLFSGGGGGGYSQAPAYNPFSQLNTSGYAPTSMYSPFQNMSVSQTYPYASNWSSQQPRQQYASSRLNLFGG